jgi:hypothetical protein
LTLSIEYKVLIADLQDLIDSQTTISAMLLLKKKYFHAAYHTYPEITKFIHKVIKKHSSIASLVSIGQTYENQEIFGIKLGAGKAGDKGYLGEIVFNSGSKLYALTKSMHANGLDLPHQCL